jgi:hypothetical protein
MTHPKHKEYFAFAKEHRAHINATNPQMPVSQVNKCIGKLWNESGNKKVCKPDGQQGAYYIYMDEMRREVSHQHPYENGHHITSVLSEMWQILGHEGQKYFVQLYEARVRRQILKNKRMTVERRLLEYFRQV